MDSEALYFCADIEANGPTPGHYSMLSFACVAFKLDETIVSTFERNLELLPDAKENEATMEWWKTQPEAWAACRVHQVPPQEAMKDYVAWVLKTLGVERLDPDPFKDTDKKPVFIAHPATFDHSFINWYLHEFVGYTPFFMSALDIVSYSSAVQKKAYKDSFRPNMPERWKKGAPAHTHKAIDDAIGHSISFCRMVNDLGAQIS